MVRIPEINRFRWLYSIGVYAFCLLPNSLRVATTDSNWDELKQHVVLRVLKKLLRVPDIDFPCVFVRVVDVVPFRLFCTLSSLPYCYPLGKVVSTSATLLAGKCKGLLLYIIKLQSKEILRIGSLFHFILFGRVQVVTWP